MSVSDAVPETARLLFDLQRNQWEPVLSNEVFDVKGNGKGVSSRRWMHTPSVEMLRKNSELFLMDLQIR